jgi:hypothetical protein
MMTSAAVHHGRAEAVYAERSRVLDAADATNPELAAGDAAIEV